MTASDGQPEPDCSDESLLVDPPRPRTEPIPPRRRFFGGLVNGKHLGQLLVFVLGALILFGASWASTTASESDLDSAVHKHEQRGEHPRLEERLRSLETKVDALRLQQADNGAILRALGAKFGIAHDTKGSHP